MLHAYAQLNVDKESQEHSTINSQKGLYSYHILVGGNDWQKNLKILTEVLDRLHKFNLHLKLCRCEFLKPEVVYLGLRISAEGLQPVEENINAVKLESPCAMKCE